MSDKTGARIMLAGDVATVDDVDHPALIRIYEGALLLQFDDVATLQRLVTKGGGLTIAPLYDMEDA